MAKAFASILLQLRQESGISQRDAAAALGISQSLLSHYEKATREPRLDFIIRAAAYYHVTTDYLLGCSAERVSSGADAVLSERHLALLDSMRFVFCRLEEDEDTGFAEAAGRYLTLALYKICRCLCIQVPGTAELFAADEAGFSECADAAMKREEAIMKRWARRHASQPPRLASLLTADAFDPLVHAAMALLHRSEHLMGDCIPLT